ncbi:RDD family protein [Salinispirillum marinum]|uniref:RDD family protein n=2 Tax=Saccharospirillaceae TaxID=255527 RepID=A0ABV8BFR3_9GAMM
MTTSVSELVRLQWRRLAAFFYDVLVVVGLLIILSFPYLGIYHWLTGADAVATSTISFQVYLLFIVFGYVYLSWQRAGQTIGMKAWRIKAINQDGNRLNARQILLRFTVGLVSVLLCGLGYFWAFVDPQRRTLPERVSNSTTVFIPKNK